MEASHGGTGTGTGEAITITKFKPDVVRPTMKKTYDDGGLYYLSPVDELLMGPVDILICYEMEDGTRRTENLCETIKQALAKVLVHFYPFAGSLVQSPDGRFMVKCTGEGGVSFVEAVANCELRELGDFTIPNLPIHRQLVHACNESKNPFDIPLLSVQVTRFQCGGFVLGLRMNHCMSDGTSLHDNISGMNEDGSNFPFIRRDEQSVFKSFTFDLQKMMQLKKIAMEDGTIKSATDFELIMAFTWRARTKALKMNLSEPSKVLIVSMDGSE
ncbi:omega-hydroxypalmitate O-feruloyl transferase-like [Telopea speciosissima]|uniref:omega-hydroxypalmitate O-feruloyl transferase-like n=1 Tax=Telopea speciosissima TaxID=54955 RepID=UPI001CC6B67C|nr:omega-hydroxypalmitate O-feruloyl transferase-like [Telopea speciosissima]